MGTGTKPQALARGGRSAQLLPPCVRAGRSAAAPKGESRRKRGKASAHDASATPAPLEQPPDGPADESADEGKPGKPKVSDLTRRIVLGLVVGGIGGFGAFNGGIVYCLTVCLIVFQCVREYHFIIIQKGRGRGFKAYPPFLQKTLVATCLMCVVGAHVGVRSGVFEVAVFWLLSQLLVVQTTRKVKLGKPKRNLVRLSQISSLVFGLVYCGYLPSFWARLRAIQVPLTSDAPAWLAALPFISESSWTTGLVATVTSLLCIVSADVGGYAFGRMFGRTPLNPVSPKKTVEGAAGGLLSAMGCALAARAAFGAPVDVWASLCLGFICFLGGLLGDLIESSLKREVTLKDSGNVLPGHGGVLDRFDSYIFTGALVYFFWYWYLWYGSGVRLTTLLPPGIQPSKPWDLVLQAL